MKKHTIIYMKYFGYGEQSFIPSEISGLRANDIHHIEARGRGGNPSGDKDVIENLMALTREEHNKYGDKKQYLQYLKEIHALFMSKNAQ